MEHVGNTLAPSEDDYRALIPVYECTVCGMRSISSTYCGKCRKKEYRENRRKHRDESEVSLFLHSSSQSKNQMKGGDKI